MAAPRPSRVLRISELFREAFRAYRLERAHVGLEKTRSAVHARSSQIYPEDDIEGCGKEVHSERSLDRKAQTETTMV